MNMPNPTTLPLRNTLLNNCWASGADVNQVIQTLLDVMMISVIAASPDVDTAERNVRHIADDMISNIHRAYAEFHAMATAQRGPRQ
jgi:hypothetical protein